MSSPVIGIVELRKSQLQGKSGLVKKPSLRDISESIDIEYRITVGMILHNELLVNKNTNRVWQHPNFPGQKLPVLELHVDKNKEAYYKDAIWFKCNPIYSQMIEMTDVERNTILQNEV